MSTRGTGSAFFASILLMVAGTVNIIYGIAALDDSKFFVGETRYVFSNLNTWGWITLRSGDPRPHRRPSRSCAEGSSGDRSGSRWPASRRSARCFGVGGAYPFWSLGVFAICIVVIHGLAVYDPEAELAR